MLEIKNPVTLGSTRIIYRRFALFGSKKHTFLWIFSTLIIYLEKKLALWYFISLFMILYILDIRPIFWLKTINWKVPIWPFSQIFCQKKTIWNNLCSSIFKKQPINNYSNNWYFCHNSLLKSSFLVQIKQCGPNKANLRYLIFSNS